jgi:uncharacterized protein
MALFFSLLPLYLFGNFHCMGMCGPLVVMIGQHRYRLLYFIGRTLSFTLAGLLAGEVGAVLNIMLNRYHIPALTSFLFGSILLTMGLCTQTRRQYPGFSWLSGRLSKMNQTLSMLMLQDSPLTTFLFGFCTILLPCGQTLIVFSACALAGDWQTGLFNGLAFALLTSPSLIIAMHANQLFKYAKSSHNVVIGGSSLLIGVLAFCRGLAEIGLISHLILNPEAASHYHIVVF